MSVSCLVTKLLSLLEINVTTPSLAFSELGLFMWGGLYPLCLKKNLFFFVIFASVIQIMSVNLRCRELMRVCGFIRSGPEDEILRWAIFMSFMSFCHVAVGE